jgi:hypothetical protein
VRRLLATAVAPQRATQRILKRGDRHFRAAFFGGRWSVTSRREDGSGSCR